MTTDRYITYLSRSFENYVSLKNNNNFKKVVLVWLRVSGWIKFVGHNWVESDMEIKVWWGHVSEEKCTSGSISQGGLKGVGATRDELKMPALTQAGRKITPFSATNYE